MQPEWRWDFPGIQRSEFDVGTEAFWHLRFYSQILLKSDCTDPVTSRASMFDLFAPRNDVCTFDALRAFVNLCGRVVVKFSLLVEKDVSCMIYNAVNSEESSEVMQWGISNGFNCEFGKKKKKSIFLIWSEYVPLSNLVSFPCKKQKRRQWFFEMYYFR